MTIAMRDVGEIWLLCDWPVAAAGLQSIIREESSLRVDVRLFTSSPAVDEALLTGNPDLVIADPMLLTSSTASLLHADNVSLAAFQLHLLPQSVAERFVGSISLTDRHADIVARVRSWLDAAPAPSAARTSDLSPREKDVVRGIVKGLANKEIASEMNVSVNTIMTHRRNIAAKLRLHSPAALTIYAIATGLVSLDDVKASLEL